MACEVVSRLIFGPLTQRLTGVQYATQPKGDRKMTTDPHYREACAAQAAMAEFYSTVWKPKPGDQVRVPKAFGGGYQPGTVHCCEQAGTWLVDTAEGRLRLYTEELERA
jgi:hypothetical protein